MPTLSSLAAPEDVMTTTSGAVSDYKVGIKTTPCFQCIIMIHLVKTLRPRQNDRLFADDIFTCIFLNENV